MPTHPCGSLSGWRVTEGLVATVANRNNAVGTNFSGHISPPTSLAYPNDVRIPREFADLRREQRVCRTEDSFAMCVTIAEGPHRLLSVELSLRFELSAAPEVRPFLQRCSSRQLPRGMQTLQNDREAYDRADRSRFNA